MAQSYRAECSQPQVYCVLIADDLTGACDAAAPFRAQGASVRILLNLENKTKVHDDVISVSTGSRDLPAAEMKHRLLAAAANLRPFHPGIVFKKIDSTLRGNPGEEIAAALDAFHCETAVIAPAFPEMGRHVRAGYLHSDRDPAWQPIHIETLLRTQGIHGCEHISANSLPAALARASRFVSLDANVNEDLETIVRETLHCRRRILWVGSAGLATALARALFPGNPKRLPVMRQSGPVLFTIGSDHIVTAEQMNRLSRRFAVQHIDADCTGSKALAAALRSGRHTILKIGRNTTSSARIANLLAGTEQLVSALLLSGGDTASLVCNALRAQAIALQGDIVTGLPWGIFDSGSFDNLPVATKSGAFGGPDALIEVAEFFSCLAP
jgi:uncharacterized protein YgbK (DUF1537 family)